MSEIIIYEDKNKQSGHVDWSSLMSDKQQERGRYYQNEYFLRRGEVDAAYKDEWDRLQKLYENKRDLMPDDPDFPNSRVPILTPTVEGQVASIMEGTIDFVHKSNNPGHKAWMSKYDAASMYYRRRARFNAHFKDVTRTYDLIGNGYVTVAWQKNYGNKPSEPGGFPRLFVPPVLSVLVDGRIKDAKDLQYADYIIHEIGFVTIKWAREEYGDDKADAIATGLNRLEGEDPDISLDDMDTFMLLHVWTRDNDEHNLQLIEMDTNGLILRESDPSTPYYTFVNNEYPFGLVRMIPQQGKFYGIGDGQLIDGIQETVNNLTDELELAARFNAQPKTFVDAKAHMAGDALTSNPADPIYCDDPKNNIYVVPGAGINNVVPTFIAYLEGMRQKATRFSDILTGNQEGSSATATQINSQMIQGSVGIKDKKTDIAELMAWADRYCLQLCMQYWDKPFWASISDNYSEYIDMQSMINVPATVPLTSSSMDRAIEETIESKRIPTQTEMFEYAVDEDGETVMTEIDFYTEVIIGDSMPKGKADMYNILVNLAGLQTIDDKGMTHPVISYECLVENLERILGMKLKTEREEQDAMNTRMQQIIPQSVTGQNPVSGNSIQRPQLPPENMASIPGLPGSDQRRLA